MGQSDASYQHHGYAREALVYGTVCRLFMVHTVNLARCMLAEK